MKETSACGSKRSAAEQSLVARKLGEQKYQHAGGGAMGQAPASPSPLPSIFALAQFLDAGLIAPAGRPDFALKQKRLLRRPFPQFPYYSRKTQMTSISYWCL